MKMKSFVLLAVFTAVVLSSNSFAESTTTANRELAGQLSTAMVLVASEGRAFADARDQLTRTRLRNMQRLENNLLWIQEGNEFDVRAWEVTGEDYRVKLFQSVVDSTEEIATRRANAAERQNLAVRGSAVNLKTSQLLSAAGSLATLAEPPARGEAVSALVKTTLSQFAASLGEENERLKQGLSLAGAVLNSTLPTDNSSTDQ